MVLLGAMAIRAGHRPEWDAEAMKITNFAAVNDWIKEPVRDGWAYGEGLWD